MEIGPFAMMEVDHIKELLESKNIKFELVFDEELAHKAIAEHNSRATTAPRQTAGHLDVKSIFFEIADEDFAHVKDQLEKYGIVLGSDGSFELGDDEP